MVDHIKKQLAAHGTNATPKRTNGRATTARPAGANKPTKKDHSDELTNEQMQAARAEVVGPARLAWVNTTFGFPLHCRKYQLLDAKQVQQLDELFHAITNTQPA